MVIDSCMGSHRTHSGGSTKRVWLLGSSSTSRPNQESKTSLSIRQLKLNILIIYKIKATDFDYAQRDLFDHIQKGNTSAWTCYVQIMPEADGYKYKWNIFDVTKVWPNAEFPL